jgi:diguanylate cyclase (GGDEF)-like protein
MNLRPISARALTLYYVTALLIIAGLSIASHALLNYGLRSSEGSAAIINMTGRQRMLSQRIASLAAQIQLGNESARPDLQKAIGEFETAHDALALASRGDTGGDTADRQLTKLYFDRERGIDLQVRNYLATAKRVLDLKANDPAMADATSRLFAEARSPLLGALNEVVTIHQRQSEKRLAQLQALQWVILGIVLSTLMVEAVAIFRPMIRRVSIYTAELLNLATTDYLTGVANRRHFIAASMVEIERARRYGRPLCLLMLDADNFKSINDRYGHDAGDAALKALCTTIRTNSCKADIWGRLGGEEFAGLLIETELPDAIRFAERLRQQIAAAPIRYDKVDIPMTVSIGVTSVLQDEGSLDEALKLADALMYRAKQSGRNCVVSEAIAGPQS